MSKICVFIYCNTTELSPEFDQLINTSNSIANQIGEQVTVIVLGYKLQSIIDKLKQLSINEIIFVDDVLFEYYFYEVYLAQLQQMILKNKSIQMIIFPDTSIGKELAGGLSIDLDTSIVEGAFDITIGESTMECKKFIYSNRYVVKVSCNTKPFLVTLYPQFSNNNSPFKRVSKEPYLNRSPIFVSNDDCVSSIIDQNIIRSANLTIASIVVSVGKGILPIENSSNEYSYELGLSLINKLCSLLNGIIGASRSVVDQGIIDFEHQVGLSGKIIAPDLYLAFGISGSIQHLAGMMNSKTIVAVNTDINAPIFLYADYGIVEDMFKILPAMINILEKRHRNDVGE